MIELKEIIAILLTPIYFIIQIIRKIIEISYSLGQPLVDGVINLKNEIVDFWFEIFEWKKE